MPIEIKSGQTVASDFFKDLDFWRNLPGQPDSPAGLVYGGDASFGRRGGYRLWLGATGRNEALRLARIDSDLSGLACRSIVP